MAVEDLEKYWTALDKALLRYHGQKIGDINRIIRELWQKTYTGEDIEGIEIVSGEESGSSRASRSYNYRVVMRKGAVQDSVYSPALSFALPWQKRFAYRVVF
jgi:DNA repair protein RAD50